jgi:hypothetical protein
VRDLERPVDKTALEAEILEDAAAERPHRELTRSEKLIWRSGSAPKSFVCIRGSAVSKPTTVGS